MVVLWEVILITFTMYDSMFQEYAQIFYRRFRRSLVSSVFPVRLLLVFGRWSMTMCGSGGIARAFARLLTE